ncbi:MAG: ATP synthase F1 subunit gamma [Clostridiales Family XIII bacterium]|jgi:F-type H+-transporting ATPase subunit gamma|nr:ATP synthase F1 subunit gamma [Clostridiales Family XIII bacterium]
MAQSMQDIKRRVKSVTSIEHITNAMKLVSAAKLRRAKATFEESRQYFHLVTESIEDLFVNHAGDIPSKYINGIPDASGTCYVIVTSNRGLAGSFNANVIKRAEEEFLRGDDRADSCIISIGSKGRDYCSKRGYEILKDYSRPPESIRFRETRDISRPIIQLYDKGEIRRVMLVYTHFVSTLEQRATAVQLLPFEVELGPEVTPHEKYMEYDPSPEELLNYLVPKYVEIMVYAAIVESATCEHAARRMAMENATDNAQAMISDLQLFYNRARQAAITREITEIVSGAEALD